MTPLEFPQPPVPTGPFECRLDQLRILKDGWLDGKGTAPSAAELDWLSQAFSEHFPDDLRLPYLYPVAEGGVQAEWSLPPYEITLEIDLVEHKGEWHELDLKTEAEDLKELHLDEPDRWQWLAERLRRIPGGPYDQRGFASASGPRKSGDKSRFAAA